MPDSHDPDPSVLTRSLLEPAFSNESAAKRQKANASTILARAKSNVYATLDDVLQDIDDVVAELGEKYELPNSSTQNHYRPNTQQQMDISLKLSAFKKRAHMLVENEKAYSLKQAAVTKSDGNGRGTPSSDPLQINTQVSDKRNILTLYGRVTGREPHNASQLFSSLQVPRKVPGESEEAIIPLREAALPTGIAMTQLLVNKIGSLAPEKKQRVSTLGELFPTPSSTNIPALKPPKPSKVGTTRSSTLGWYQPSSNAPEPRSSSYFTQPVSTADWIEYSNVGSSPPSKRKRDRAMSLTGSKPAQLEAEPAEAEAAKLDALFRGAYSGFAPTVDNSAAIVPEGTLNRLWWERMGEKSFERFVENANKLDDVLSVEREEQDSMEVDSADKDDEFRNAVEWYEKHGSDPSVEAIAAKSAQEKDVEEILEGISELLETLNSYQRNRNVSLKPAGSQVGILATPDSLSVGTPAKPSDQEMATYEILKAQLSLMISSLPPFAVAKLQPNKLAELGISTRIPVELYNYHGILPEDEAGIRAKAILNPAATVPRISHSSQPASLQRNSSTPYGNQYSVRPQPSAIQQGHHYGSQTPSRAPASMPRPAPAAVPYQMQNQRPASNTPYRPTSTYSAGSYGNGTPSYAHQATRPVQQQAQQQYNSSAPLPSPLYAPPTQGYARPVGQSYQNSPHLAQATPTPRYASQPSYPQQSQSHTMNYQGYNNNSGYNNTPNAGRQPSPQKPAASMYAGNQQSRAVYSASTPTPPIPALMPDRRPYLNTPMTQSPMMQSPMGNGGMSSQPQSATHQQQPTGYGGGYGMSMGEQAAQRTSSGSNVGGNGVSTGY